MTGRQFRSTAPLNYLTRLNRNRDRRHSDQRRKCAVVFNILYPSSGMRVISRAQLRVLSISEGEMRGTARRRDIADHFYISIGDDQLLIPCAVVARRGPGIHARFIHELPTVFVDVVASLEDPFVFLEHIRPALYGLEGHADD